MHRENHGDRGSIFFFFVPRLRRYFRYERAHYATFERSDGNDIDSRTKWEKQKCFFSFTADKTTEDYAGYTKYFGSSISHVHHQFSHSLVRGILITPFFVHYKQPTRQLLHVTRHRHCHTLVLASISSARSSISSSTSTTWTWRRASRSSRHVCTHRARMIRPRSTRSSYSKNGTDQPSIRDMVDDNGGCGWCTKAGIPVASDCWLPVGTEQETGCCCYFLVGVPRCVKPSNRLNV